MASGVGCGEVEGEVTYRMTDEGDARRCFQTARDVYFVPGSGENIEYADAEEEEGRMGRYAIVAEWSGTFCSVGIFAVEWVY